MFDTVTNKSMCKFIYLLLITVALTLKPSSGTGFRNCRLGTTDFKKLLKSKCFVDKSLLILKFLAVRKRVVLLTAPSGFGKTANMEMIRAFLDTQNKDEILDETTKNCELFQKYNLSVYRSYNHQFFNNHCGQNPVIMVKFKSTTGNTFKDYFEGLKQAVKEAFLQHSYLLKSYKLDEDEKEHLMLYTDDEEIKGITRLQLSEGLLFLSETLYNYFRERVIILIDDYDALFWPLLKGNFSEEDVTLAVGYTDRLLTKLLTANKYLEKALINARVLLSDGVKFNNAIHFSFLEAHPFAKFYGFTYKEIRKKTEQFQYNVQTREITAGGHTFFYGGYDAKYIPVKSNKTATKEKYRTITMYRTTSIINLLQNESFDYYWNDNEVYVHIKRFFLKMPVRQYMEQALDGRKITIDNTAQVKDTDIISLKIIIRNDDLFDFCQAAMFIHVLIHLGYFVSVGNYTIPTPKYANFSDPMFNIYERIDLKIPNEEVRKTLFNESNEVYLQNVMKFDSFKNNDFLNALNALCIDKTNTSPVKLRDTLAQLFVNNIPDSEHSLHAYLYTIIHSSPLFLLTHVGLTANITKFVSNNRTYFGASYMLGVTVGRRRADLMTIRATDRTSILVQTSPTSAQAALDEIIDAEAPLKTIFLLPVFRNYTKKRKLFIGLHLNAQNGAVGLCSLSNRGGMDTKYCL